jgi:PAS domain S-box-containing protein
MSRDQAPGWDRQTLDAIPDIAWVAYPDGTVAFVNQAARSYAGLPLDDLVGWDWSWVVHPADLPETLVAWAEAVRTGAPYALECRLRRHDGAYRWFAARAAPVRGPDGQPRWWVGTCTDVDRFKLLEDHSRTTRTLFRALVERGDQARALLAADRTVRYASPAVGCVLGFRPEDLIGTDLWSWAHPDDRAALSRWLDRRLAAPGEWGRVTARFLHRDGRYHRLRVRGTSLMPDPDVRGVVVALREAVGSPSPL